MSFSERFGDDWNGGLESCCGIWLWLNFLLVRKPPTFEFDFTS